MPMKFSAAKKKFGGNKRVTAKQKAARKKNIEIARKHKKKGKRKKSASTATIKAEHKLAKKMAREERRVDELFGGGRSWPRSR